MKRNAFHMIRLREVGDLRLELGRRGDQDYWLRVSHAAMDLYIGVRSLGTDELAARHMFDRIGDRIQAWRAMNAPVPSRRRRILDFLTGGNDNDA